MSIPDVKRGVSFEFKASREAAGFCTRSVRSYPTHDTTVTRLKASSTAASSTWRVSTHAPFLQNRRIARLTKL